MAVSNCVKQARLTEELRARKAGLFDVVQTAGLPTRSDTSGKFRIRLFPTFSEEARTWHGKANRPRRPFRHCARRRCGSGKARRWQDLPRIGDFGADVLQMAASVLRPESRPGEAAQRAGARKRAAEDGRLRANPRQADPEGGSPGEILSPSRKRACVDHVRSLQN